MRRRADGELLTFVPERSSETGPFVAPDAPELLAGDLYDHPAYADLIYRARTAGEVRFLAGCWRRPGESSPKRLLEAASGPGRLMLAFARRGFQVGGFDTNPAAVGYCNARLHRYGFPRTARMADLRSFEVDQLSDAAFCMLNGFRHLTDDEEVHGHFEAMARALRPGGLYVVGLELTRPGAVFPARWRTLVRHGRLALTVDLDERAVDPRSRLETRHLVVDIETPRRWRRVLATLRLRTYTAEQFSRAVRDAGEFELIDAFDLGHLSGVPRPLTPRTEDAAFVLRRR